MTLRPSLSLFKVIVHAYDEFGDETAAKLDGDFAFVIVDQERGEYYAARDPIGVNSMYVGKGMDGSIWFASEVKALVAGGCASVEIFPPGHYMSSKEPGVFKRYWKPAWFDVADATTPLVLQRVRDDFISAVDKRLMADVPYGVLLSGGLDSSLVASVAHRLRRERGIAAPVPSYCIGLEGSPDLAAARRVADFIGTDHLEFTFTVQEGIDAVSDVIYHLETYDITTIRAGTPLFLLARRIKSLGIKMVLSGEGADESLAGYLYFHKARETRPLSARSAFPLSHRPISRSRSPPTRRRTASSCTRSACARCSTCTTTTACARTRRRWRTASRCACPSSTRRCSTRR